jgi:TolB protein
MKMVYAQPGTSIPCFPMFPCGAPGVDQASLQVLPFDGSTWGAPTQLVAYGGQNNYYPTYSPDAAWVMFNRSPSNANSFDAPDAQVWIVSAAGGTPLHMATASSSGGDSWPKWAPDVQPYRGASVMWFTFSSRRAYGLRTAAGAQAQIWMAAFDPARATAGTDPSYPSFWLPFQEADSGNHIAQWVTEVERQPCFVDGDCPSGEFCEGGVCVPVIE